MSDIRIGTSGWSYDHWNTVLYEPSLAPRDRLRRYTQEFDTVELNASFYRWPQRQTFRSITRAMSCSDGLGVSFNRPAVAMIMPGVQ